MAAQKMVKRAPVANRRALRRPVAVQPDWAQRGRERAEVAARINAGLDHSLAEAAEDLLRTVGEGPEVLVEMWQDRYGGRDLSAFAAYQLGYLERLREMVPTAEG